MEQSVCYEIHEWCIVGKKFGTKSTKISSPELVRNSKLEEQEKIIKPDGTSFVMTNSSSLLVRVSISSIALCTSSRDFSKLG
jgi:hypothetical protein